MPSLLRSCAPQNLVSYIHILPVSLILLTMKALSILNSLLYTILITYTSEFLSLCFWQLCSLFTTYFKSHFFQKKPLLHWRSHLSVKSIIPVLVVQVMIRDGLHKVSNIVMVIKGDGLRGIGWMDLGLEMAYAPWGIWNDWTVGTCYTVQRPLPSILW